MNTADCWRTKLNSGGPVSVPETEFVQTQWYDGLALGHFACGDGAFVVAFASEAEGKNRRIFFGYYLSPENLEIVDDQEFLRSWLSRTRANVTWEPVEYEAATVRLLNLRTAASDCVLIEADPAFGKILRSVIVPKGEIEKHWLGLEDFYSLSEDARRLRHEQLAQLIGENS